MASAGWESRFSLSGFVPVFEWLGVTSQRAQHSLSFGVAFTIITFLHIVLGELAPKSLAIQRPRGVSLWIAAPLLVFYYIFFPFIYVLNGTANMFLRWAGLEPASESEHAFSADELEYVLSHSRHIHPGDALVNKIMVRSLRLRDVTAQQVMLSRTKVVALWADKSIDENLKIAQKSGHSRFPVCQESLDNVLGMVLIKEWLWQIQALGEKCLLSAPRPSRADLLPADPFAHNDGAFSLVAPAPCGRHRCKRSDARDRHVRGCARGNCRRDPG